ncbi:hypothetical protein ABW19_dt0208960 [Dactylella cylindrospora]|nr:hypothetical protein ABW19_dt0208960 [Dactylella cylindrospora]
MASTPENSDNQSWSPSNRYENSTVPKRKPVQEHYSPEVWYGGAAYEHTTVASSSRAATESAFLQRAPTAESTLITPPTSPPNPLPVSENVGSRTNTLETSLLAGRFSNLSVESNVRSQAQRSVPAPGASAPSLSSLDTLDFDENDLSNDELDRARKIDFHKAEIERILREMNMSETLYVHVSALVETYGVVDDFKLVIYLVAWYMESKKWAKAMKLLRDFKYDGSLGVECNLAAYILRAQGSKQLGDPSSALKDCQRAINLSDKCLRMGIQDVDVRSFSNFANYLAAECCDKDADVLYYSSQYKQEMAKPSLWLSPAVNLKLSMVLASAKRSQQDTKTLVPEDEDYDVWMVSLLGGLSELKQNAVVITTDQISRRDRAVLHEQVNAQTTFKSDRWVLGENRPVVEIRFTRQRDFYQAIAFAMDNGYFELAKALCSSGHPLLYSAVEDFDTVRVQRNFAFGLVSGGARVSSPKKCSNTERHIVPDLIEALYRGFSLLSPGVSSDAGATLILKQLRYALASAVAEDNIDLAKRVLQLDPNTARNPHLLNITVEQAGNTGETRILNMLLGVVNPAQYFHREDAGMWNMYHRAVYFARWSENGVRCMLEHHCCDICLLSKGRYRPATGGAVRNLTPYEMIDYRRYLDNRLTGPEKAKQEKLTQDMKGLFKTVSGTRSVG